MLEMMSFDLKMDREIEDDHYISPGSFTIKTSDGEEISFDFHLSEGKINKENSKYIHFCMSELDVTSFPRSKNINTNILHDSQFIEFFIYTGEDDEPEIYPEKIINLTFEFSDGSVSYFDELSQSATKALMVNK